MAECGSCNVPSIQAYQEMDEQLRLTYDVTTARHNSSLRNEFYVNSIVEVVAKVSLWFSL